VTGGDAGAERAWHAVPFVLWGFVGIIGGGLVAAVTHPLGWLEHGSWAAAYLVLVVGVAQLGLGVGQAWLADRLPGRGRVALELVTWNAGSALVVLGTLVAHPWVVDLGGVLLVVALAAYLLALCGQSGSPRWARWTYRLLVLVVLVSVPVGLVLSTVRHP
jgi:hypothetical protein